MIDRTLFRHWAIGLNRTEISWVGIDALYSEGVSVGLVLCYRYEVGHVVIPKTFIQCVPCKRQVANFRSIARFLRCMCTPLVIVSRCAKTWHLILFEGVSNIITLLRFPGSAFSGTSLLGKRVKCFFSEFLEIISSFFAQNFFYYRVDILLCSERNKTGGFRQNLALWPLRNDPMLATSTPTTPTTPSVITFTV